MEDRLIKKINTELGGEIENLSKSKGLVDKFVGEINTIERKLNIEECEETSIFRVALQDSQADVDEIEEKLERIDSCEQKIAQVINRYKKVNEEIQNNLDKINELEKLVEYFRIVQDIQDISSELSKCLNAKDEQKIVNLFLSLSGSPESSDSSVIGRLHEVEASNLKMYSRRVALHWHDLIKEKLSAEFETILKSIKWPNLGHALESLNPNSESLNKLMSLAEYLFLVQLPGYDRFMYVKLAPSIVCPPIATPIELLLKPFRVRFEYHFMNSRQTNRIDKPEYYFTQILNWAKDNHHFVGEVFQGAATRAGVSENVRLEFVRGLVQLTIEKLINDIEEISFDEQLFAHLIDEILSFEQDLRTFLFYPSTVPSAVNVLTQATYFTKWLKLEEKFTSEKMDQILSDENDPWASLDPFGFTHITSPLTAALNPEHDLELEELKIPKCADQFVRILEAIKERYCILPQPSHQLQFLALQIDLIDCFRRRLGQLHKSEYANTLNVLNAIFYIISVLREWGENVHYLHLHAALLGPNVEEISSVFDKNINELEHWQGKLIKQLSSKFVDDIKSKTMSYRHDCWVSMPKQNEPLTISQSASEMFHTVIEILHSLESVLSTKIFISVLRRIAKKLDDYFIDSMIMNIKFSEGGAEQFKFDITRNLVPLFGQYSRKPGLLFKNLSDACILLSLPFGTAILLHETLKPANKTTKSEDLQKMKEALKEVGIVSLPILLAVDVIERRIDICH